MKIAPRDVAGLIKAPGTQYSAFCSMARIRGWYVNVPASWHIIFVISQMTLAQANLTGQQVSEDKVRLADEANAVNIFGGLRLVTLSGSGTEMTEAVKLAFANPKPEARIIAGRMM